MTNNSTSNSATAENRNKRTRIADQPDDVSTDSTNTGTSNKPANAVKEYLTHRCRSLPNSLQKLITNRSFEFISINNKIKTKTTVAEKFKDETYVPRSARFEFKLTSTESVMETDQFKTLAENCTKKLQACQKYLKSAMKAAIELELSDLQTERKKLFCKTLRQVSELVLIMNESDNTYHSKLANYAIEKHHENWLKYMTGISCDDLKATYKDEYGQDETPLTSLIQGICDESLPRLNTMISTIVVGSADCYYTASKQNDLDSKIAATISKLETTAATDTAAMDIEVEPSVTPANLANLVNSTVANANKTLVKRIQNLEQNKQRGKNVMRGANTMTKSHQPGASTKKNMQQKNNNKNNNNNKIVSNRGKKSQTTMDDKRNGNNHSQNTRNKSHGKNSRNGLQRKNNGDKEKHASADDDDSVSSRNSRNRSKKSYNARKNQRKNNTRNRDVRN